MNTKNNKRRRESVEKIEKALVQLLQTTELKKISIADICKETGLNRKECTYYNRAQLLISLLRRV